MDCYQFIDIDSKFGVGRSSVPEKSDFDRNLRGVLVEPPVDPSKLEAENEGLRIDVQGRLTSFQPYS